MASKKKPLSKNRLLVASMAAFIAVCSFKIVSTQMEVSAKQYAARAAGKKYRTAAEYQRGTGKSVGAGKERSGEVIGRIAFEQYGYGYPDEHIYIDSQAS